MPLAFRISPKALDLLHKRFPNWYFVMEGTGGHDHPISHATTQVVAWELINTLKAGKSYLDLHGNPSSNERFAPNGVTLDTYVSLASPKDYLRMRTKWGSQTVGGRKRYHLGGIISNRWSQSDDAHVARNRDGFLSVHTGYYYTPAEVLEVLKVSPEATLTMIMHRFVGKSGSLNDGELQWKKESVEGRTDEVTQVNTGTGETYRHPDNNMWFDKSTWTDVSAFAAHTRDAEYDAPRALTWTLGMCCEGVYKVTVCALPAHAAYLDETVSSWKPEAGAITKWGGVDIEVGETVAFIELPGKAEALFDDLRKK